MVLDSKDACRPGFGSHTPSPDLADLADLADLEGRSEAEDTNYCS